MGYIIIRPAIEYIKKTCKGPLVGAEIGVLKGQHARSILNGLTIRRLYLVDPYINYSSYPEKFEFDFIKQTANKNLEPYKDNIVWINKKFDYGQIPEKLDFIYIDGNHVYEFVKIHIEIADSLVKTGGIVSGHDYYHHGNFAGVGKAVDEFCNKNGFKLNTSDIDWWYIKQQSVYTKWYELNYF